MLNAGSQTSRCFELLTLTTVTGIHSPPTKVHRSPSPKASPGTVWSQGGCLTSPTAPTVNPKERAMISSPVAVGAPPAVIGSDTWACGLVERSWDPDSDHHVLVLELWIRTWGCPRHLTAVSNIRTLGRCVGFTHDWFPNTSLVPDLFASGNYL